MQETNILLKPEVIDFIKGHLHDDPFSLSLNAKKQTFEHQAEAVLQIQARQKALKKLSSFAQDYRLIFPKPISVEQASSEDTAKFKADLFAGTSFADLTGGMGVDSYFFSKNFKKCIYVESDGDLCQIAKYNFKVLKSKNIHVIQSTAEEFIRKSATHFDLIFLDPSRRTSSQQKVFRIEDCQPNVMSLENLLLAKADNVLVKLSPLVDITSAFLSFAHLKKVWVLAVKNECKEVLCWLSPDDCDDKQVTAVNINADKTIESFEYQYQEEYKAVPKFGMPSTFIYEPNAAIMKSGAFKIIASRFEIMKLHKNTHLYTSDAKVDFPGRIFKVNAVIKLDKKEISKKLGGHKVNVISRNFHLKADEVTKKFKLLNGDDKYIIATTLADNSRVLLDCERVK